MDMIIHGVEPPISCIECPFLSKPKELYLPLMTGQDRGLYRKVSRCTLAPETIDDPYRSLEWFIGNTEAFCPIERRETKHD